MSNDKNFIQRLFSGYNNPTPIENIDRQEEIVPSKKGNTESFIYREVEMFGVDLKDWRWSVEQAWSETDPDRKQLADIYKAMTTYDAQTITAIQQRKLFTMQGDIAFYNEDGSENEEATKLIKTPAGSTVRWFRDFMSYSLDSIFWGFELIAINVIDGQVVIKKVPERNIVPNEGYILRDTNHTNHEGNRIPFNKGKLDLITCKVSYSNDLTDLGLLSGVAPYFFSKATGSWKMHADKFGMLTRVLKTNSENKKKLTASYNALKNQVRGNFVVLGEGDELTFEGDTRTSLPYKELNDSMDQSISKIILGQTSTTDEKSFSGSANVHKSVLDAIIRSDREFIETVVNDQLVKKLQLFGMLPQNVYFGISESVNVDLVEQSTIIKTLSDAGYKVSKEYIEETFDMPLDEVVEAPEENKKQNKDNGENN